MEVTVALIRKNGKYLLAQRKKGDAFGLKWEFPGGTVESNETPEDCLKREIKEELGLSIEPKKLLFSFIFQASFKMKFYVYCAKIVGGRLVNNSHERLKWISLEEISNYDLSPADLIIVKKLGGINELSKS